MVFEPLDVGIFVALALFSSCTVSYCYEHPKDLLQSKGALSSKTFFALKYGDMMASEASTNRLKPNQIPHFALYRSSTTPETGFAGAMATFDFYDFPHTKNGSQTSAQIWLQNDQNSEVDLIISGWEIDPDLYQDSKTHFFVYWTIDGAESTGCSNLDCTGFVPVNGAPITPGDTLDHSSGQTKISFKIFKSKYDGDWWLHFGHDISSLSPVGYWANSIFKSLDHTTVAAWGGYTVSCRGDSSPPMGNGQWPEKGSASIQNVQFVDKDGQGYIPHWPGDIRAIATHKKCYQASIFQDDMFYYEGPGGCTD